MSRAWGTARTLLVVSSLKYGSRLPERFALERLCRTEFYASLCRFYACAGACSAFIPVRSAGRMGQVAKTLRRLLCRGVVSFCLAPGTCAAYEVQSILRLFPLYFFGQGRERDSETGEHPRSRIYALYSVRAVPIPLSVSNSRRIQFSTLPSTMVTISTPSARAERQHSIFGIIPPLMVPSA